VGFHNALQNPQLSRPSPCITLLRFISWRRSVRQLGSSFANFIKSYGSYVFFFCKLRCNNSLTSLKEKGHQVLAWVCGSHFLSEHSLILIPFFLIIPSDAFGVTSIYLLLNTLNKISKFQLSIPVATKCFYISGVSVGFSLARDLLHLVPGRPPYYSGRPPCR
jgi:hypothetical protein